MAPLPVQYADYAAWQRERLQGEGLARELGYWRTQLADLPTVHGLPLDRPRPAQQSFEGAHLEQVFDAARTEAISGFCKARDITPFVFLQTVFAMLLGRFSREDDIVMGTPVAGRVHADVEPLIGLFLNTLVLRTRLDGDPLFETLLARSRDMVLDAHTHQEIPFETLVEDLKPTRSLAYNPLTQILINSFDAFEEASPLPGALQVSQLEAGDGEDLAKAELTLYARRSPAGTILKWSYRSGLFAAKTIERMAAALDTLVGQVLADPGRPISSYRLLTPAQELEVLAACAPRTTTLPGRCLHESVFDVAASDPSRLAIVHGDATLTFGELARRARSLAHALGDAGVRKGDIVAILLERGIDYAVAVLGALSAGATYLPLAVDLPDERLRFMLEDAGAGALLTRADLAGRVGDAPRTLLLEDVREDRACADPALPAVALSDASHLLYTSGSTGRPKGAICPHSALLNRAAWMHRAFPYREDDVCCLITSTAFVRAVWELLVPLAAGQPMVVVDAADVVDLERLAGMLHAHRVTRVVTTPSLARALLEHPGAVARLGRLRHWFVSGEPLKPDTARFIRQSLPAVVLCNLYGSTETMSDVASHVVDDWPAGASVPIGRAIDNCALLVLDDALRPVPVGVAGEICVSGANLAIGYLGREALTAEKFPGHALGPAHGGRLYRTGDLGRLLDDGTIECLGRLDHQVKIRGYRIELGEIESRLQSSPRVRDAVVTVAGSGESSFLAAYVVPATAAEADDGAWLDALRQELRDWLPDYMCPASWIPLPGLPLTANGKVDRRALPAPELLHPDAGEPPRTATEAAIAAIWSRLLKRDDIAANAHFFEMGGHSLLATRVVGEISRALDKPVAIRKLFEYPVLRDLAAFVDTAGHAAHEGIPVADRDAALPLSFAQQRLWLVDRMQSGSAQYNMPVALELEGPLRVDALQAALDALVARHEVLRTVYADAPDGPVQRILPPMRVDLAISRATGDDPGMRRDAVLALARREALEVFDLAEGPVLRARLVELDRDAHALLLTVHHIASDGGSQAIMVRELVALYAGFAADACPGLAPLPLQYADFAAWQRARMTDDRQAQQLDYWRTQLAGLPVVHGLPLDRPRPPRQGFDGERVEQSLPSETLAGLKALALRHDASLFMVLQAAFALLLHRWSGEEDIVVGTPVAGRLHRDLEPLIGIFVNTLVLRNDLSGDPGFDVLLARTRETVLQAFEHQEISFEALVDALRPERSLAHAPLFQVLFALQNHEHAEVELRELSIRPLTAGHEQARVDLQLTATEHGEGLRLGWLFARDLFERASIERMGHALATLLQGIVDTPSLPVSRLPLLPVGCEEAAPVGEAGGLLVHTRFEAHAAASPGCPAVACDGEQLDYATLNARANRLAHALANAGAGPETRVALHVARGIDMVAGMLGILKSGAAYVAIDPELPAERKRAILADSEAAVVLTQASLRDDLEQAIAPGIAMLDCEAVAGMDLPDGNPVPAALDSTHAAYVVYTSGSTGAPKGVILEHRGLMNLAANQQALYGAGEGSRVLAFASVGFDGATWEWLMALASGACLQVCTQAERHDPDRLADLLVEAGITHAAIPPAMLAQLDPERAYPLEVLIVAGEACEPALAWRWARRYRVCNSYGPSEATVAATHAEIQPDAPITLGTSLRNVVVRVADRHGRPQPVGVVGEICIGGVGLARGYLGQPVLTAERFVPDPLRAGERLYRTGDLGRRLPDGRIEFRGRNDHQLKLRGYRIEPGEIEARLCALAGVREALVMAREDRPGERRLVAYVAGDAAPGADADARTASWRNALKQALPDYMVPSAFVVLDALPVTPNGKVDRRALPVPVSSGSAQALPPRPGTEARLAALWSELLGVTAIGREDNFFELGGHSLLATRLVSAIGARLGRQVPVRAVFEHPRLSAFADCVDACPEVELQGIPVADRSQALALSFAQQRLWFIDRLEGGSPQYNMPMALRLRGRLDETALQAALDALVARHEPLRTVFVAHHGEARQDILPPSSLPLRRFDLSTRPAAQRDAALHEAIASEAAAAFDLSRDPMLRCALLTLDADEHVLVMTVHHIASDGWSQGILAREFAAVYAATTRGEGRPDLPLPPLQYADYAAWQRSRLGGEAGLRRHVDYWREQLAGIPVSHALPLDRPRPPKQRFEGRRVEHTLDAATTARLNALAATHDASLFMVLHAAFALLVSRWSGESDVVIGTPIAGRAHPDLEGLVGFFINTLALRVEVDGASSFEDLLVQARATALAAFEHQDVPFDMLVEALRPDRSLNHAPIFQISFSFHNIEQPVDVRLPGLTIEGVRGAEDAARFDLELHVGETADGLRISWLYAQSLFDHDTIERMSRGFEALLGGIANAPASGVLELPMVDAAQAAQLAAWGEGERVDVDPGCVHALFERHARATPAAIAVVHDGESLDYDALNRESNRLAHYLREQGVGAGDVVGLCTERSADMVVGLLGILKAGAAYLPLDPEYPEERVLEMLDEAGAEFVVTHASVLGAHPALSDRSVLPLDAPIREALLAGQPGHDIAAGAAGIDARSLAYVVFTSGSTGRPKGVLVEHGGLVNLAANQRRLYAITPSSQVLAFASIGFDAAVWEWLMALAHGATLHVCGTGQRGSAVALCDLLEHARITHATLPPALLPQLDPDRDYALEALILAGEAPDTRSAWAWAGRYPVCNAYGPSENTVAASSVEVAPGRRIMLGRPMANVRARVVNAAGGPQPVGVAGELLLGGAGLARGYLGRAELTAERFIEDAARPGERLYRTGDLVRWAATGEMEFVGRVDDQVKIRGFRIETGEIEVRLREHPSVREAVVAVHGASAAERRLVAYVVVAGAGEGDDAAAIARALRGHLRQTLPEYMVPAAFVGLERLPLNRNGKIDKARLPEPRFGEAREHVEPVGPTERALAALWAELLDVDGIGRDDNFFELGGHSLLAIKLGARFHERFGKALNVSDLFAHPSLAELAACLDGRPAEGEGDEAWSPLVGLSTTADAPTVYCVPGAGLTSAAFVPLARAAGDRLRVRVFESRGFRDGQAPHANVEAIVEENIAALLCEAPAGPYLLAGHSFGGAVAFEMARVLEARGEQVGVVLLDSLLCLDEARREASSSALASMLGRWITGEAGVEEDMGPDGHRERLQRHLQRSGLLSASDPAALDRFLGLIEAQIAAFAAYRPSGRVGGPVGVVLAAQGQAHGIGEANLVRHYQMHCERLGAPVTLQGGHVTLLSQVDLEPLVDALFSTIRAMDKEQVDGSMPLPA
ncbi:amino acid adenylation domain-containing protein [Marilutibacter spongiae]|uniref:non-ribosomal peptide synthetase n=1 Tax=Marilutibacter spongiae TaxID=2025720 RepID=UPI0031B5C36D